MREIKFRAWHKEQGKMYSAGELGFDQMTIMPDGRGFANISGDFTHLSQVDNGNKMLPLQYTGLKDKNGYEIYDGDIFRYDLLISHLKMIKTVQWEDRDACWFLWDGDAEKEQSRLGMGLANRGEVIGNIYENPKGLAPEVKE